jgi:hypothetical protein
VGPSGRDQFRNPTLWLPWRPPFSTAAPNICPVVTLRASAAWHDEFRSGFDGRQPSAGCTGDGHPSRRSTCDLRGPVMQAITIRDRTVSVAGLAVADPPYLHAGEAGCYCPGARPPRERLDTPTTWPDPAARDRTPGVPGHELSGVVVQLAYGTTGLTIGPATVRIERLRQALRTMHRHDRRLAFQRWSSVPKPAVKPR